jgi:hypothetical protein
LSSPEWRDIGLVLLVFWTPAVGIYMSFILREMILLRRSLRLLKQDLRTSRAEGYPPPGPPTTDSQPDDGVA